MADPGRRARVTRRINRIEDVLQINIDTLCAQNAGIDPQVWRHLIQRVAMIGFATGACEAALAMSAYTKDVLHQLEPAFDLVTAYAGIDPETLAAYNRARRSAELATQGTRIAFDARDQVVNQHVHALHQWKQFVIQSQLDVPSPLDDAPPVAAPDPAADDGQFRLELPDGLERLPRRGQRRRRPSDEDDVPREDDPFDDALPGQRRPR